MAHDHMVRLQCLGLSNLPRERSLMSQFNSLVGAIIAGTEGSCAPECRLMVPELEISMYRRHSMVAATMEASDSKPSTVPWCYGYVPDAMGEVSLAASNAVPTIVPSCIPMDVPQGAAAEASNVAISPLPFCYNHVPDALFRSHG